MLDGRHFPHILDAVIDYAAPSTLVAMSQVCSQWRQLIKREFYHWKACNSGRWDSGPLIDTRLGRMFSAGTLVEEASGLLRLCRVLDADQPDYECCVNDSGILDGEFTDLTALRLCDYLNRGILYGMRIAHYVTPPKPGPACRCCHGNGMHETKIKETNPNVKRFVFTTWGEDGLIDTFMPPNFASLSIIFLFDSATKKDPGDTEEFWKTFCEVVFEAWSIKKPCFVINAECLDDRQQ